MSEFKPDAEITMTIDETATGTVVNNLTTTVPGFALDARQGKALDDKKLDKTRVANNLTVIEEGWTLDARQGKWLNENKLGFSDIANDLETDDVNKVLSAAQAKVLANRTAPNAEKLGGKDPSYYLPAAGTATNASKLGGKDPSYYLPATGTATDSSKLGGNAPSYYLPAAGTATDSSKLGGKTWASRLLEVYPVGCIYISENATSPASLFGGTWTRITDRFLLGCQSTTYPAGSTGGEATHKLTVAEMPSHFHQFQGYWKTDNTGEHAVTSYEIVHGDQESVDSACKRVGGDQPHNNMPPYLAVYMWKRLS